MYQGVEKKFWYDFVYIAKKIASYFLVLLILIELLVHYCSLILLWDKKEHFAAAGLLVVFYNTFAPFLIALYLNFIKSKSYLECLCFLFTVPVNYCIIIYANNKLLESKYKLFYYFGFTGDEYFEFLSSICMSVIFISSALFFSLIVKIILSKIKKDDFPQCKINLSKVLKVIFILFFLIPFSIPGLIFLLLTIIEILIHFRFEMFYIFSKLIIFFQITNIIQLYLNIYRSKNYYEQVIGFLMFCINLLISFIYIVFSSNVDLPKVSVYFNIYYTFFPVIFALGLKYLLKRLVCI